MTNKEIAKEGDLIQWEYLGYNHQAVVAAIDHKEKHYFVYVDYGGGQDMINFDSATIINNN